MTGFLGGITISLISGPMTRPIGVLGGIAHFSCLQSIIRNFMYVCIPSYCCLCHRPPSLRSGNTVEMGIQVLGTSSDQSIPESFSVNGVSCVISVQLGSVKPEASPTPPLPGPSTKKSKCKNKKGSHKCRKYHKGKN